MTLRVAEWINYRHDDEETAIGWLGGWFDEGNTWDDYTATMAKEVPFLENSPDDGVIAYVEAIRDDVLTTKRFITGNDHQYSLCGAPKFTDGA